MLGNVDVTRKLHVYSREQIECLAPRTYPHAFISIRSPWDSEAKLPINELTRGVLRLSFEDLDTDPTGTKTIFQKSHADEILSFVALRDKEVDAFLIHCHVGNSRSQAVAAALAVGYGATNEYFWEHAQPNKRVYSIMLGMNVKP